MASDGTAPRAEAETVSAKAKVLLPAQDPGKTLDEARNEVAAVLGDGTDCPCCGQFVRGYKRKLNANMVVFLISLVRVSDRGARWVHHSDCKYTGRDYSYVASWGLAETHEGTTPGKKMSGNWKPTARGLDFVDEVIRVPSHVFLYNNQRVGATGKTVSAREALGKKFDYDELMRGV